MSSTAAQAPPPLAPSLDVETYISNYSGVTRLKRLAFIAAKSTALKADALRMALEEVKRTTNTSLYLELAGLAEPAGAAREDAWVEEVDRRAAHTLEKLEAGLAAHKSSLVKESIRMGHTDLAEFYFERGDFQNAFKCFVRTRDYCTTAKHVIAMCLGVIRVSIHMENFTNVSAYVGKAETTPAESLDAILVAQLKAAAGLAQLEAKNYGLAARKFVEVSPELGSAFNDVLSLQDVALYGGLCALASFSRDELKSKLIDNGGFRTLLELFPDVRELINDFYHSKYASCLQYLRKLEPDLLLDIHLHDHVDGIIKAIQSRAIIQYFSPYVRINMIQMAAAFQFEVNELERNLASLISSGQIEARIDSHHKVLYARHDDQRSATFRKVLSMGEDYMRDTKALLLRINLMRHDFILKGNADTLGPSKSSRQDRQDHASFSENMSL
ncbi:hypothetical protein AB1Y20_013874 [Prymnesium parvum]|uniref:PCI domain-containing protein n=1 Tax=Prymnesium parvum TaxID=97485 RepID=A0AB34IEU7_PRYPA